MLPTVALVSLGGFAYEQIPHNRESKQSPGHFREWVTADSGESAGLPVLPVLVPAPSEPSAPLGTWSEPPLGCRFSAEIPLPAGLPWARDGLRFALRIRGVRREKPLLPPSRSVTPCAGRG